MMQLLTHQKLKPVPKVSDVPAPPRDKIVYNFQYDLESVWWIVLWTFLARVAYAPGQDYAPLVYVNRLENTTERQLIFLTESYLLLQKKVFRNDLHPFLPPMVNVCNELRRADKKREGAPNSVHPIVRAHEKSGKKALYLSRLMTDKIVELSQDESDKLLDELFDYVDAFPSFYEHSWKIGDSVIWDNRAVAHSRSDFSASERRLLKRVTIVA